MTTVDIFHLRSMRYRLEDDPDDDPDDEDEDDEDESDDDDEDDEDVETWQVSERVLFR